MILLVKDGPIVDTTGGDLDIKITGIYVTWLDVKITLVDLVSFIN